jgi:serine/threonine protein kinase
MLGSGSSARVYEGRWCGRKCAVKVLFTAEITAEEIRRTCYEASLLHTLQATSPHVVGLFGVAVLPPSLCVVLELCSEGSLGDMLYNKKHRFQGDGAHSQGGKAVSTADDTFAVRNSMHGSTEQYDFVHLLPWAQRLELALGASRGIEAFAKALPGYSHNDIKVT